MRANGNGFFGKLSGTLAVWLVAAAVWAAADSPPVADKAAAGEPAAGEPAAGEPAAGQAARYALQYRFSPGEVFRCQVTHLTTVDTKIRGVTETVQTRSVSTKAWKILDVSSTGEVTFSYTVEEVRMWQQISGREEIRYDSTKDQEPPDEYRHVAETVGVSMGTITISPSGEILRRENARPQFNPGIGELTVPLPVEPVQVGERWTREGELPIRLKDGRVRRIKTRHVYRLEKVQTGVATISARTEVLTPVDDPAVQSQLVQRVKRGEVRFDVDAGRVLYQQMDIDERVLGFSGADSMMRYLARLSEETL